MSDRRKQQQKDGQIPAGLLLLLRLLMLGAIAISAYLASTALSGTAVAGCGPASNCDKVLHSRWAYWFGIPVSLPALLMYAAVFALTLRMGPKVPVSDQRKAWPFLMGAAVLMFGAAIWFSALQYFVIRSFCPYCMTAHILGLAAAAIILLKAPIRPPPEKSWQQEKQVYIPPAHARNVVLVALISLAALAGGQALHQQKLFSVQSVPATLTKTAVSNAAISTGSVSSAMPSSNTNPPLLSTPPSTALAVTQAAVQPVIATNSVGGNVVDHRFQVYLGMFQFDLREVPVIGSADAPYAMLSLFDYTCHHCRIMHPLLMEAHRAFPDKLAIVSLPMPLDSTCNYTVRRTPRAHTNACHYAELGLAVWRADRKKHPAFDEFIFTGETPPSLHDAAAYARQLVGPEGFDKAIRDPWVNQQLTRGISVYATNFFHVRNGSMPQIMINTNLTTGTLNTSADLFKVLDKQLGLRPDP